MREVNMNNTKNVDNADEIFEKVRKYKWKPLDEAIRKMITQPKREKEQEIND